VPGFTVGGWPFTGYRTDILQVLRLIRCGEVNRAAIRRKQSPVANLLTVGPGLLLYAVVSGPLADTASWLRRRDYPMGTGDGLRRGATVCLLCIQFAAAAGLNAGASPAQVPCPSDPDSPAIRFDRPHADSDRPFSVSCRPDRDGYDVRVPVRHGTDRYNAGLADALTWLTLRGVNCGTVRITFWSWDGPPGRGLDDIPSGQGPWSSAGGC
jgi:hypothetical protein